MEHLRLLEELLHRLPVGDLAVLLLDGAEQDQDALQQLPLRGDGVQPREQQAGEPQVLSLVRVTCAWGAKRVSRSPAE